MASRKKAAKRDMNREQVPELFVQMRNTSVRCLEICLSCTRRGHKDPQKAEKVSESYMQIVRFGRQMKQQLMDMKSECHTRGLPKGDVDTSLNVSLNHSHVPLRNEICSVRNKALALMRMQTFNTLLSTMKKDAIQRQPILGVMNHSMNICTLIMLMKQSNTQLEEQLAVIRRRRIETRLKQQELYKKLKFFEKTNQKIRDLETKTQEKGKETIQNVTHKILIIQEIFQRLILSTQMNWAEDPHLKNLLLKMRDPLF
ncbi:centromere protein H-like [Leptodactylus fuscus]|uniref:centromere protein H-like n=1 Tax=Leptodactylus fuscus TaxID=238119 RepID=UPI003F4E911F